MEVLVLDGLRLLVGKSSRNNVPSSTLDKAEYLGRFAFLPRLSFFWGAALPHLNFFCRVLIFFSAATYSHVTVASSVVACINADISVPCVFSYNKG